MPPRGFLPVENWPPQDQPEDVLEGFAFDSFLTGDDRLGGLGEDLHGIDAFDFESFIGARENGGSFGRESDTMVQDHDISVRFKRGKHTIFLFVDPMRTLADVAAELLRVLQDRYPNGLGGGGSITTTTTTTPLPADASRIAFAVLEVGAESSAVAAAEAWRPLDAQPTDTLLRQGIQDNDVVAFAFRGADDEPDKVLDQAAFSVTFPDFEEGMEDQPV